MDVEQLKRRLHPVEEEERKLKDTIKKHSLAVQIIIATIITILVLASFTILNTPRKVEGTPTACFKHDVCIDLIIVTTPEELEMGLSNYSSLPDNTGMLFVFDKPRVIKMWMKDMKFPIDIIWLDKNYKITKMERSVMPCPSPEQCDIFETLVPSKYVLEVRSGFAIDTNLFESDSVEFKNVPRNLL